MDQLGKKTLTGREENVVSIVLDPRRDCDVIADGLGKGATENGRSATTHSRILHRHFEWRQHHFFKISNFVHFVNFKFWREIQNMFFFCKPARMRTGVERMRPTELKAEHL